MIKKKSRLEKYLMNMYTCVYSMIHNRQKAEATQVSTDRWMDKQNVVHKQWNVSSVQFRHSVVSDS